MFEDTFMRGSWPERWEALQKAGWYMDRSKLVTDATPMKRDRGEEIILNMDGSITIGDFSSEKEITADDTEGFAAWLERMGPPSDDMVEVMRRRGERWQARPIEIRFKVNGLPARAPRRGKGGN